MVNRASSHVMFNTMYLAFQWLPVEDRAPRFLEWFEDVQAKFELVEWSKKAGEIKKWKTFLTLAGADIRSKVGTDYES